MTFYEINERTRTYIHRWIFHIVYNLPTYINPLKFNLDFRFSNKFYFALKFRWLKDLFQAGLKRPLEEDEIYEVKDGLRSDKNTQALCDLWDEELLRKNPSIIRAMYRLNGLKLLVWGLLFCIAETGAR